MLPRQNRLPRFGFDRLYKKGKIFRCGYFVIRSLGNNLSCLRLAAVVSKKISNKSSQRNKIKRLIKAVLAPYADVEDKGVGLDMIISAVNVPPYPFKLQDFKNSLEPCLKRLF